MPTKKKQRFDLGTFIAGVERPTRVVQLCTDVAVRERLDSLMREVDALPATEDESLAGDQRRESLVAEIREITDTADVWTAFTVKAPTRTGRVFSTFNLIDSRKDDEPESVGDDSADDAGRSEGDSVSDVTLRAEARLIADCLVAIDGNPVTLTFDQAEQMQQSWPFDLVQELVDAIRELGSDINSVPFSRRLSQTLKTPVPSDS